MNDKQAILEMIARISRGILARYPFDSDEDMAPRWRRLAEWQAALVNIEDAERR